ncbi:MAG: hypothetical protein N3B12_04860 [Armatimonadetes bacterium]|nr:hypothetical protein [Armatimonadota bacterium]
MFRTILWLTFLLIVAVYGGYALVTVDRRPDEVRIRSMIANTVTAVQNRDLGGTIACISRSYRDDQGLNFDRLRVLIAQAFRAETSYTASARVNYLKVKGDSAEVGLRAEVQELGEGLIYSRNLTLHLRSEHMRHMGIVPTKVWRVVRVDNLGLYPEQ